MNQQFEDLREHILEHCTTCGQCVKICPGIEVAALNRFTPNEIQTRLRDFIRNPRQDDLVSKRIDSCLECFKCVDSCPQGLQPLACIEIAKTLAFDNGYEPYIQTTPDDFSTYDAALEHELTEPEKKSVITQTAYQKKKYVFFPGCNIYKNPTRLLHVKDMLHYITDDIAFLPGLEYCCGDRYIFDGRFHNAEEKYAALAEAIERYDPETVILWCPTCLTRMKTMWKSRFNVVSFFQFCRDNITKFPFVEASSKQTVTLHEPCKTAYTALDSSHRDVIKAIPGLTLRDMPSGIRCCGSGGFSYYRDETLARLTFSRLHEAANTGAELLITVCHYCQEVFEHHTPFQTLNFTCYSTKF